MSKYKDSGLDDKAAEFTKVKHGEEWMSYDERRKMRAKEEPTFHADTVMMKMKERRKMMDENILEGIE